MIIKNHFHKKGFALGLVLKQRLAASRKWPIASRISASLKLYIYKHMFPLTYKQDLFLIKLVYVLYLL